MKAVNKNELKRIIIYNLIVLSAAAVIGFVLIVAVHFVPVEKMRQHVIESLPMIEAEFGKSNMVDKYPGTFMGAFTDCLMLEHSVYDNPEHTALEQALMMYRGESGEGDGWAPGYSLIDYLGGAYQSREVNYARYWHGYLVVLKPLLLLTNYETIRMIQANIQLILAGMVLLGLNRYGKKYLNIAFIVSLPFIYFFCLYNSLSLSICYYILAIALIAQAVCDNMLRRRKWYALFFLIVGAVTAYFDFLTYPIVTLGFPLCVCICADKTSVTVIKEIKRTAGYTVEWFTGYVGLWAIKWIITDAVTHGNTIADAVGTVLERTGSAGEKTTEISYLSIVGNNMEMFANWGFYLLMAVIITAASVLIIKTILNDIKVKSAGLGIQIVKRRAVRALPCILVAMYPFIWYMFTQNHSYEHSLFTCKILSVTVFSLVCAVGRFCDANSDRVM